MDGCEKGDGASTLQIDPDSKILILQVAHDRVLAEVACCGGELSSARVFPIAGFGKQGAAGVQFERKRWTRVGVPSDRIFDAVTTQIGGHDCGWPRVH